MSEKAVGDLARGVARIYGIAEELLLAAVADELRHDAGEADRNGVLSTLPRAQAMARLAETARRVKSRLDGEALPAVTDAVTKARARGRRKGAAETKAAPKSRSSESARRAAETADREAAALLSRSRNDYRSPGPTAPLAAFARATVDTLRPAHESILRQTEDAYRDAVAKVMTPKLVGAQTKRIKLAEQALADLADRGVTGFTDRSGRRWELETYVEMATRTASARAMVEGQLDRHAAVGETLFWVNDAPAECALCRPYEHKILRYGDGETGRVKLKNTLTGKNMTVTVKCTLAEAMAKGFLHPNCRHAVSLFLPGVTVLKPTTTRDPEGEANRQRLRALEREVRRWRKRAAVAAPRSAEKRDADAHVKAARAAIAEHVARTGLIRQPRREQIGRAR